MKTEFEKELEGKEITILSKTWSTNKQETVDEQVLFRNMLCKNDVLKAKKADDERKDKEIESLERVNKQIKEAFAKYHSIVRTYENKRNKIRKTYREEKESWSRKKKEFEQQLSQKAKKIIEERL